MQERPEYPDDGATDPVEARDVVTQLRHQNAALTRQSDLLTEVLAHVVAAGLYLTEIREHVGAIREVVDRAAPLLNSGPARALTGRGSGVLGVLKGARAGGGPRG